MSWQASFVAVSTALLGLGVATFNFASGAPQKPAPAPAAPSDMRALQLSPETKGFIEAHCVDCHDADQKKGDLDLTALTFDPTSAENLAAWTKIHDQVARGEMPPKKKAQPTDDQRHGFTASLGWTLSAADEYRVAEQGRATQRRLNRYEYEATLRDLFGLPYLDVKDFLPEDTIAFGFNKVGDALDVSHVQMSRYLTAAEFALREAIAPQVDRPKTTVVRYHTWDQSGFRKNAGPTNRKSFPMVGLELQTSLLTKGNPNFTGEKRPEFQSSKDKERRDLEATAVVVSNYEPTEIQFNGFRAPISGRYHLKFSGYSIWMAKDYKSVSKGRRPEPVSIYADTTPRILRKLGGFDFGVDPTVCEIEVWLKAGETIRPDAARLVRSRPPEFKNPFLEADGMPGVAFQWMEVDGPLFEQWPPASHKLLFGDLPIKAAATSATGRRGDDESQSSQTTDVEVLSDDPERDAKRLLRRFIDRVYRHPAAAGDVNRFAGIVRQARDSGYNFTEAMLMGYTAVLSSPGFLYLQEEPGALDDLSVAERLSFFLWNAAPDPALEKLAQAGELRDPAVLSRQVDRMLDDPRSRRFIDAFLDYWLDLRQIAGTAPDVDLYPEYQLDDLLVESLTEETQRFFAELVRRNLGVSNLVDSDFAVLNERLATHYGMTGVDGVDLRPVPLPPDSVRGGLLTQASVLKVTANGTTTSPVVRGAWVMSRLLGKTPPPPPPSIPAVEPDTRGATTIRQQLDQHRAIESCAACHKNIDPPGFALESFDVMGGFRQRYRSVGDGEKVTGVGHHGQVFKYLNGPAIDPSGELPGGQKFDDVQGLKACLLNDQPQLARNLVRQMTIYATGAPIGFSDREKVEKILEASKADGYGVRTLIHELVKSELFLNK